MKFFLKNYFYILLFLFPIFFVKSCVGSTYYDGNIYNINIYTPIFLQDGDNAVGKVGFRGGFTVTAGAGVRLNVDLPVSTFLDLRTTGSLELSGNLILDSNVSFSSGGIIGLGGNSLLLNGDLQIPENSILEFASSGIFDGQGHDVTLGKYAQLLVDGGVTVTFKNMTIKNTLNTISCPPIRCMDWYSQACFDNVIFAFNDDFAFRNGQFFIYNDVEFTGTSKFSYRSVRPSYITQHSNMIFDSQTIFEYYPSTTDNALIKMQDKTSSIIFDGSTLQTTHTGLRLTGGSIYFDNKVTLSSVDNTCTYSLDPAFQTSETDKTWSVAWSPNGRYLAVGNEAQANRLYRLDGESLTLVDSTSETDATYSVAWSPNGQYLAVGNYSSGANRLYRLDGESLTLIDTTSETDNTSSVAWSPDGRYLAVGNYNQASRLYRLDGESLTLVDSTTSETDQTYSVAWSPNGQYLAAGNYGQANRLYRLDGESLTSVDTTIEIDSTRSIAWSLDGLYLAVGNYVSEVNRLYRLDGESLTLVDSTTSETDNTSSVAWSPDGHYLAAGTYSSGVNRLYRLDGESFMLVDSTNEAGDIYSIAWSPDGCCLAVGNYNRVNRLYKPLYYYDTSPQAYSNSIVFGDSEVGAAQDLYVYALAAARIGIYGKVWCDCVNGSWNFQSRDSYVSLDRYDSLFKITNAESVSDWKKNQIIKSSDPNTLFLQDNQIWTTDMDQLAPEETFELVNNLEIPDGQITQFSTNVVIDGQGHDLILGKYAQLLVDGGVTVTFKNMTIKNTLNTISCPPIRCMDWYSQACFDNVTFAFNDDWAFRNGQFFIYNDVEFTGTSKFSYRSVRPSYITQHSNMIFDPQTTFEYYPSTTDNALIKMTDKTASIIFDGSTLQTTHTGIRLTKGSIYFDNKVTLSSVNNTYTYSLDPIFKTSEADDTYSVAWSPDGRYLAVGNSGVGSRLYRLDGESLTLVDSTIEVDSAYSVAWSPNGRYLVVGNGGEVNRLYRLDGESLTLDNSTSETDNTRSVAWSPNGRYLVVGNSGEVNRLYRLDGESLTLVDSTSEADSTWAVAWSPDGHYLAVGNIGEANRLYRQDGESLTLVDSTSEMDNTYSVAWSPNGQYLAAGNYGQVNRLYRLDGESLTLVDSTSETDNTLSVAWSPDGHYLVAGTYSSGVNRLYRLDGKSLTLDNSTSEADSTWSVAWSPDGRYLAVGNYDNEANRLYKVLCRYDTSPQGYSNGIIFGNSVLGAAQDLDVYALGGANINIAGKVWYDDVE